MADQAVLFGGALISVLRRGLLKNCETFQDNPDLLKSPYRLRSAVGDDSVRTFLAALSGQFNFSTDGTP
jgi:hypothetical protein